ncbi:MAG: OmpA family protein, partial [Rhodocyclaceae bacterium]|nr:OmpA family protein [Rhodocyclaceae bacterium]
EGHTDNAPINTPLFPSNWELSGARAASVVRLFIETGVDPRSLTATGYAEQRPIADNASAEGRQRNRRVAINMEAKTPDQVKELALPE